MTFADAASWLVSCLVAGLLVGMVAALLRAR
jgi:xanthosine utilization system XapX-like protein